MANFHLLQFYAVTLMFAMLDCSAAEECFRDEAVLSLEQQSAIQNEQSHLK